MTEVQTLNEATLASEALKRLGDEKSVLRPVAGVLELVAHSSVGLGEVLQDYAQQSSAQLAGILRAAENASCGTLSQDDVTALMNINFVLKSVKSVLQLTPQAMQRNKADALGEKEKLTRADITAIAHAFLHSPEIARLLAAEDSGHMFEPLAQMVPASEERLLVSAGH
jgi:hypothetical protein